MLEKVSVRFLRRLLILSVVAPIVGCAFLSEQPLGEIVALDPEEWDGLWLDPGGEAFRMTVIDAEKAIIMMDFAREGCEADTFRDDESEAFQLRSAGRLSSGEWYFVYWFDLELDRIDKCAPAEMAASLGVKDFKCIAYSLFLGPHRRDQNTLTRYVADEERVRDLVLSEELPGRIEDNHSVLGELGPEHYEALLGRDHPAVIWDDFETVTKVPSELDPCKEPQEFPSWRWRDR
jgi:hypothetical protein